MFKIFQSLPWSYSIIYLLMMWFLLHLRVYTIERILQRRYFGVIVSEMLYNRESPKPLNVASLFFGRHCCRRKIYGTFNLIYFEGELFFFFPQPGFLAFLIFETTIKLTSMYLDCQSSHPILQILSVSKSPT